MGHDTTEVAALVLGLIAVLYGLMSFRKDGGAFIGAVSIISAAFIFGWLYWG
ncbi:MAG: hypothetical protein HKO04_01240 [Silicimonas sp.]|nr:hypothetical protein [Silicimonas sp.]